MSISHHKPKKGQPRGYHAVVSFLSGKLFNVDAETDLAAFIYGKPVEQVRSDIERCRKKA